MIPVAVLVRKVLCRTSPVACCLCTHMKNKMHSRTTYQEAISALNSLQTNASVLANVTKEEKNLRRSESQLHRMEMFLHASGIMTDDLDALNAIHVSGTKGKGTTCALIECILRHHGFRTGFFSSPHLVHVRERIRICGKPLDENVFTEHFWNVYNKLQKNLKDDFPAYFQFLTVLAFKVFLKEKVDVAIVEVGIGGAYDCTNVIRNPKVCAVTTLDMDHVSILGDTIECIAWQKAGIFKPGSVGLTIAQEKAALTVLAERAKEIGCPLFMVPPLDDKETHLLLSEGVRLNGQGHIWDVPLALHAATLWLQRYCDAKYKPSTSGQMLMISNSSAIPVLLRPKFGTPVLKGLKSLHWPGRYQVIKKYPVTYFVDGAHTPKSLQFCSSWFKSASASHRKQSVSSIYKILIFNCTADRQPSTLLPFLVTCDFDFAIFCPNIVNASDSISSDMANLTVSRSSQLLRCEKCAEAWRSLMINVSDTCCAVPLRARRRPSSSACEPRVALQQTEDAANCIVVSSVGEALDLVKSVFASSGIGSAEWKEQPFERTNDSSDEVHVLVTGSLHLVGSVLSCIDPHLKE